MSELNKLELFLDQEDDDTAQEDNRDREDDADQEDNRDREDDADLEDDEKRDVDIISSIDKTTITTRKNNCFEIDKITMKFSPHVGDVVNIIKHINEEGEVEIVGLVPNQHTQIIGRVVTVRNHEGRIVDESDRTRFIYFTTDVCHMQNINLNDRVSVTAIQFNNPNERCRFRAIGLKILDRHIVKRKESNSQVLQPGAISFKPLDPEITLFVDQSKTVQVMFTNILPNEAVEVVAIYPGPHCPDPLFSTSVNLPIKIEGHAQVKVDFICNAKNLGTCDDCINVNVVHTETKKEETCGFVLRAIVEADPRELPDKSCKKNHYWKFGRSAEPLSDDTNLINPPRLLDQFPFRKRTLRYEVPQAAKDVANSLNVKSKIRDQLLSSFPHLVEAATEKTYGGRFHDLLFLEECEKAVELRKFDIQNIRLHKPKHIYPSDHLVYLVDLPGFGENYSLIMEQDTVVLSQTNKTETAYKGIVVKKAADYIEVLLNPIFSHVHSSDATYTLRFQVNRNPIKLLHAAVDAALANLPINILFPTSNIKYQPPQVRLESQPLKEVSNKNLNENQLRAVEEIVLGKARPYPYVIFGPPGTGKTVTLVEAVLQIYDRIPDSRILIATPSNSAADLIALRLLESKHVFKRRLTRLCALHYENFLPEGLKDYRMTLKQADENAGPLLLYDRIVVSTLSMAGKLVQHDLPDKFTHVLIDEAGQATEPQTMLAVALLGTPKQIVLAGDPKQLGPVVIGKTSEMAGLGKSYQHRLLECSPYVRSDAIYPDTQGYNPHLVTMLVKNYRSLPALLEIPSKLFYDNLLKAQICPHDSNETKLLLKFKEHLPIRPQIGPPALTFCGVRGNCEREEDSPSWYNDNEAVKVCMYLKSLYKCGFSPSDIGIITPYSKQVQKIKSLMIKLNPCLRKSNRSELTQYENTSEADKYPKVGTVEEFQGQERYVILFSGVKTGKQGNRETIGFVDNPHRINTAITRARSIMIIIGDPHLLSKCRPWAAVINYCVKNNAYTGCNLPFALRKKQTNDEPQQD